MTEARWQITDPQNRIRRLAPVADGTVNVQIVLPNADDPAAIAAVEQAAAEAGIEITRVAVDAPAPMTRRGAPAPIEVVVNGVRFVPTSVLPS